MLCDGKLLPVREGPQVLRGGVVRDLLCNELLKVVFSDRLPPDVRKSALVPVFASAGYIQSACHSVTIGFHGVLGNAGCPTLGMLSMRALVVIGLVIVAVPTLVLKVAGASCIGLAGVSIL